MVLELHWNPGGINEETGIPWGGWEHGPLSMPHIPDEAVDLVVTSPPYNMKDKPRNHKGKSRGKTFYNNYSDDLDQDVYEEWIQRCIAQCYRVLKPGGQIYLNHKPLYKGGECFWPFWIASALEVEGFKLKDIIIWKQEAGADVRNTYWLRRYEVIFWAIKGDPYKFNDNAVRVESIYSKRDRRYNNLGAVPANVWNIPRLHNSDKWRESGHPALFHPEVVDRIIQASTDPGDMVVDPFGGIGTTVAVAGWNNRSAIAFEISKKYVDYGNEHLVGQPRPKRFKFDWLKDPKSKQMKL